MADKSSSLILEALSRAAADPAGLPLFGSKAAPGLFAASASARQAAEACKQHDYLRVVRTEAHGKTKHEVCVLTEKGLNYLVSQTSPKKVLDGLVQALDARRNELAILTTAVQQLAASLDAFRTSALKVMDSAVPKTDLGATYAQWLGKPKENGAPTADVCPALLATLDKWHSSGAGQDCPLPKLYRQVKAAGLTIGRFHDALRSLYENAKIYLHPWTGPLYAIPDPALTLMVGHEIAYYASLRK
jgi:hypothetical protein